MPRAGFGTKRAQPRDDVAATANLEPYLYRVRLFLAGTAGVETALGFGALGELRLGVSQFACRPTLPVSWCSCRGEGSRQRRAVRLVVKALAHRELAALLKPLTAKLHEVCSCLRSS